MSRHIIQIVVRISIIIAMSLIGCSPSTAATLQKKGEPPRRQRPNDSAGQETLKLDATLVQVPAVITDRAGKMISDLTKDQFVVFEDGKPQEISMFAEVKQPFSAVLVIDTSNSASDRLGAIQKSAISFLRQIRQDDRAMVISFDNEVRELTDFTSDQKVLENAIKATESGFGKLLYEAVATALNRLKDVEGRRSVVLFSDCVDMRSIEQTPGSVALLAEEAGAAIYVVQFETRWWIEADARKRQSEQAHSKVPFSVDGRIPLPPDLGGPEATPPGFPSPPRPRIEIQGPTLGMPRASGQPGADEIPDEITRNLDRLYGEADDFAKSMATRTGGRVFQTATIASVDSAFAAIADELRNQYLIGYYARGSGEHGKFHKIKVEVNRKGLVVRTRSGYSEQ